MVSTLDLQSITLSSSAVEQIRELVNRKYEYFQRTVDCTSGFMLHFGDLDLAVQDKISEILEQDSVPYATVTELVMNDFLYIHS